MKLCDTEIIMASEGKRNRFAVRGTVDESCEGSFVLRYEHEGDSVAVEVSDGALCITRRGGAAYSICCRTDTETELRLQLPGRNASVPVQTDRFLVRRFQNGYRIALAYRLLYADGAQLFRINIALRIISEES